MFITGETWQVVLTAAHCSAHSQTLLWDDYDYGLKPASPTYYILYLHPLSECIHHHPDWAEKIQFFSFLKSWTRFRRWGFLSFATDVFTMTRLADFICVYRARRCAKNAQNMELDERKNNTVLVRARIFPCEYKGYSRNNMCTVSL